MLTILSGNRFHLFFQKNLALEFIFIGATIDYHNVIFTLEVLGLSIGLEYVWKENKDTKKFSKYFSIPA